MPDPPKKLFHHVHYYMSRALPVEQSKQLAKVLDINGATPVSSPSSPLLTHYVTTSPPGPDSLEPLPSDSSAHLVTPLWIERTLILSTPQDPTYYSPSPTMLFSGVVASSADLSSTDNEILIAGITSLGGQWRSALTKDVTHLFALGKGSAKYATAMHFRDATAVRVLTPHWFDDSVRLGQRGLPTADYEFPEPKVFKMFGAARIKALRGDDNDGEDTATLKEARRNRPLSPQKKALYDSMLAPGTDLPAQRLAGPDVWAGARILLSRSLGLNESQREAHEADIRRGGGRIVRCESGEEEVERVEEADVFVTRYRAGRAFVKAYRLNKTIGTLPWLWYVRSTGQLSRPTDQLLHYPVPRAPIEGFGRHVITITNYTGKDREYIKKLIAAMGAEFTPSMSGRNTIVIAAHLSGTKASKAASWNIPTVHHIWLEDCFLQWRDIPTANEKYVSFPPSLDLGGVIAQKGVGGEGGVRFGEEELRAMEGDEEESEGGEEREGGEGGTVDESPRKKTKTKAGEEKGEEEVDTSAGAYLDIDVPMDDDGRLSEVDVSHDLDLALDFDDDDDESKKSKSKSKAVEKTKTPEKKLLAKAVRSDEEAEEDRGRPQTPKRPSTTTTKARDESRLLVKKTYRSRSRSRSKSRVRADDVGSEDEVAPKPKPKTPMRRAARSDDDEEEYSPEKEKETPKRGRGRPRKAQSESDVDVEVAAQEKEKGTETPKRGRGRPRKEDASPAVAKTKDDESDYEGPSAKEKEKETPKRGRGRPRKEVAEVTAAQDDESDDGLVAKAEARERSVSRGRGRPRKVDASPAVVKAKAGTDDHSDDEQPEPKVKETPKRGRGRPRKTDTSVARAESDDEVPDAKTKPTETPKRGRGRPRKSDASPAANAASRSRSRGRPATRVKNDGATEGDKEEPRGMTTRSRSRGRPQATTKTKPAPKTYGSKAKAVVEVESEDEEPPAPKTPTAQKTRVVAAATTSSARTSVKRKKPTVPSDSESEGEEVLPPKRATTTALKPRASMLSVAETDALSSAPKTPRKEVSVVLPTLKQVRSLSQVRGEKDKDKENEKVDTGKGKEKEKPAEAQKTPAKRGRPPKARPRSPSPASSSMSPSPPPAPKPRRRPAEPEPEVAEAGPSKSKAPAAEPEPEPEPEETPSVTRTSKRSAAFKATAKLHNEIMPDVISFQKEIKSGHVKSVYDREVEHERSKEHEEKEKGKKGRKRTSVSDDEDEGEDGDGEPERKKAKMAPPKRKGRKSDETADGEADDQTGGRTKQQSVVKGKNIVVLTTQVKLPDDLIKAFTKLGAKFTLKPAECTHLVANSFVRTEKFLCGLAIAKHIVSAKWIETSVSQKKILPEENFPLKDPIGESKFGVTLADVLERRKTTKGKLFDGMTFYATPKALLGDNLKLMRDVVSAGGGQVVNQSPTVRILKGHDNRFVISCPEDKSAWRLLAENGFPIYNRELVLTGALKQELDFDRADHKVPGSF